MVTTREPGGTPAGEALRALLLHSDAGRPGWDPHSEALLHYAARNEHVTKLIRPCLEAGQWVVCDRFNLSTAAYQGAGLGIKRRWIQKLQYLVLSNFKPDLNIILDLPVAIGLERAHARRRQGGIETADRYESEDAAMHERIRESFLNSAKRDSAHCEVVDARGTLGDVHARVCAMVAHRFQVALTDVPLAP